MFCLHLLAAYSSLAFAGVLAVVPSLLGRASSTCTLTASGADDAPAFLKAAADPSCATVVVPAQTTLNIETRMNMTGINNKHIARTIPLAESPCDPHAVHVRTYKALFDSTRTWTIGRAMHFTSRFKIKLRSGF